MKEIRLSKGYITLVDDEDFKSVNQFKWCALEIKRKDGSTRNLYAVRRVDRKMILMHRLLLGTTDSKTQVDHINHDGLDNRRENLRLASNSENLRNQRKFVRCCSSKYKGVCWNTIAKKWFSYINLDRKRKYLGYFYSETDAARAYDTAARKYHGEFAKLNFPQEQNSEITN